MIAVFIAASQEVMKRGLHSALDEAADIEVVGEASSWISTNLVEQIASKQPDVVIWDMELTEDNINDARRIKVLSPQSRILVFSNSENEKHIFTALAAGADGYLLSHSSVEQLRNATRNVAAGAGWLDPQIAMRVLRRSGDAYLSDMSRATMRYKDVFGLSDREYQLLSLLVEGLSNRAMAERLCVSLETVKTHVRNIMHKLNVQTRTEIVSKAFREGLCQNLELTGKTA